MVTEAPSVGLLANAKAITNDMEPPFSNQKAELRVK